MAQIHFCRNCEWCSRGWCTWNQQDVRPKDKACSTFVTKHVKKRKEA